MRPSYDTYHWMATLGDRKSATLPTQCCAHSYLAGFHVHASQGQYLALLAYHLLDDEILPLDVVNYGVELQAYLDDLVEFSAENDADLDFSELEDAIEVFKKRAGEAKALEELAVTTNDQNLKDVVNHKYIHFQRGFVSQGGLPNREFYRHVVAAPGLDTGYAAVTFAGATEGIQYAEDGNFNVAQEWVSKIAAGIVVAADILKT